MTSTPRLPYQPLERILRHRHGPGYSDATAAVMLDTTRRTITRYRTAGLGPRTADRLATHLGLHPSAIWGKAWEIAEIGAELITGWHEKNAARRPGRWPGDTEVAA